MDVNKEYRCSNGKIIYENQVCDNVIDCQDFSDEQACNFILIRHNKIFRFF